MENLQLSKEEIALIKEKREKELGGKLEAYKLEAIKNAKDNISEYISESNKIADAHNLYLEMLNGASKGEDLFELVSELIKDEEVPSFVIDGKLVELKPIKYSTVRCGIKYIGETVKHEFKHLDEDGDEMTYWGDTPVEDNAFRVDAKYFVKVYEHITGYGYTKRNHGFFMKIKGLEKSQGNRNNGQKLSNAKSVIDKIKDDITYRRELVEREEYQNSLSVRALKETNEAFPNAKVSEDGNKIIVRFKNGASLYMRYYEDGNKITFSTHKIIEPNKNAFDIGRGLEKI